MIAHAFSQVALVVCVLLGVGVVAYAALWVWGHVFDKVVTWAKINRLFADFLWERLRNRPPSTAEDYRREVVELRAQKFDALEVLAAAGCSCPMADEDERCLVCRTRTALLGRP